MIWWVIARKDLKIAARDRNGWLLSLVLPVVVTTIAGFALGGAFGGDQQQSVQIRVPIVNLDAGEYGRQVVEGLQSVKEFQIETSSDEAAARASVQSGSRGAMILIPPNFSTNIEQAKQTHLVIVENPESQVSRVAVRQAAELFVQRLVGTVGTAMVISREIHTQPGETDGTAQRVMQSLSQYRDANPIQVTVQSTLLKQRANLNPFSQYVPGFAVMFLLFTISKGAGAILREKQGGTLRRITTAPVGRATVLIGKLVANFVEGLVQVSVLIIFGRAAFGVSWGTSGLGLILLLVMTTIAATCLGLLMAALFRTARQLDSVGTMVVLAMSAVGGSWWPLEITPDWMHGLAKLTLTAWAMDGFHELMWYGGNTLTVLPHLLALLTFAVVFFCGATLAFRLRATAQH